MEAENEPFIRVPTALQIKVGPCKGSDAQLQKKDFSTRIWCGEEYNKDEGRGECTKDQCFFFYLGFQQTL